MHLRFRRVSLAAAALAATAALAGGSVQGSPVPRTSHIVTDRELGCYEGAYVSGVRRALETEDTGEVLALNLRVLLNGITPKRGQEVIGLVVEGYAAAGIAIHPTFEVVGFASKDPIGLMNEAKDLYGGEPPLGTDAVYVLSAESGEPGIPKLGMAECIGGMQWREHAFAAGPDWTVEEYGSFRGTGMFPSVDPGALIAAHEVGHLLGGIHEYGECTDAAAGSHMCDVMWDRLPLAFNSFRFSIPNEAIVRATARVVIDLR